MTEIVDLGLLTSLYVTSDQCHVVQLAAEAAAQYDKLSSDNEGLASTRSAHDNVAAATAKAIQDQINKQQESLAKEQAK